MGKTAALVVGWLVVLAAGAWLRMGGLTDMPVHADEATGARILSDFIEDSKPPFDPTHFHGPLLHQLGRLSATLAGHRSWTDLSIETLRLVPALAGCLAVLVPLLLMPLMGRHGSLLAGALLATSPTLVYYNRIYIHESVLLLFSLAAVPFFMGFLRRPTLALGLLVGCLCGLMWATKVTALIIWFSWAIAGLTVWLVNPLKGEREGIGKTIRQAAWPLVAVAAGALGTAAMAFTDFFRHPETLGDAFRTFFVYQVTSGHEKPLFYYADWIFWPHFHGPFRDWEGWIGLPILLAALFHGAALARGISPESSERQGRALALFLGISFCIQFVIYSAFGYKTPWLMLLPVALLGLLGPALWSTIPHRHPLLRKGIMVAMVIGILFQAQAAFQATRRFAVHPANPRAYVSTLQSMKGFPDLLRGVLPEPGRGNIVVAGKHYWPLPWYLRSFSGTAYRASLDETATETPLVICMPDQFTAVEDLLAASHMALPVGLRLDYPIVVYVRKDIWESREGSIP